MVKVQSTLRKAFARAWWWLRQVSGDAAYESYLRSAASGMFFRCRGDGAPILSRQEFYLDSLRRKYSGVSRCC
jgi:hypothetical protein